jgi:hypothetical protein
MVQVTASDFVCDEQHLWKMSCGQNTKHMAVSSPVIQNAFLLGQIPTFPADTVVGTWSPGNVAVRDTIGLTYSEKRITFHVIQEQLPLTLIKHNVMKTEEKAGRYFHSFLNFELKSHWRSDSRSGCFTSAKISPVPIAQETTYTLRASLDIAKGRKTTTPTENETLIDHFVQRSHYPEWTIIQHQCWEAICD